VGATVPPHGFRPGVVWTFGPGLARTAALLDGPFRQMFPVLIPLVVMAQPLTPAYPCLPPTRALFRFILATVCVHTPQCSHGSQP
jgi:hypothetical protein